MSEETTTPRRRRAPTSPIEIAEQQAQDAQNVRDIAGFVENLIPKRNDLRPSIDRDVEDVVDALGTTVDELECVNPNLLNEIRGHVYLQYRDDIKRLEKELDIDTLLKKQVKKPTFPRKWMLQDANIAEMNQRCGNTLFGIMNGIIELTSKIDDCRELSYEAGLSNWQDKPEVIMYGGGRFETAVHRVTGIPTRTVQHHAKEMVRIGLLKRYGKSNKRYYLSMGRWRTNDKNGKPLAVRSRIYWIKDTDEWRAKLSTYSPRSK